MISPIRGSKSNLALVYSGILLLLVLESCSGNLLKPRYNYSVSNRHNTFKTLKSNVDAFLLRQVSESVEITKLVNSKKYTYFEESNSINKWTGKQKLLFYGSDCLTFSYFYQLEGYDLLQIRMKVDAQGRIDSLDKELQYDIELVNQIENNNWDKQFPGVIQMARDSFNLKGELYCNVYTREGLWWHVAERKTYRTKMGRYRKAVLFNIEDVQEIKAIEISLASYYD
jgi:hypothetical protein